MTRPGRAFESLDSVQWLGRVLAVLAVLGIAAPVGYLIYGSFSTGFPGAEDSTLTLEWAREVYASSDYLPQLGYTIALAIGTATLATAIGAGFAWLLWRVDVPFRGAWEAVFLAGFVLPAVLATMAWISVLAPNAGFANVLFDAITQAGDLFNVYSFTGILMVMTFEFAPIGYMLVSGAFSAADFSEEESARVHGANLMTTMGRITFPAVRLSLAVAWVILFAISAQSFAVVLLLGTPSKIETIPKLMYLGLVEGSVPLSEITMLGTLLLWPAAVAFVWLVIFDRRNSVKRVQVNVQRGHWSLGKWHRPVLVLFGAYLFVSTVLPLVALVLGSFLKFQTADLSWSLLTLQNYAAAFNDPDVILALGNTLKIALGAATVGVLVAYVLAYVQVSEPDSLLGRSIQAFTALPLALPRLAISLGFLWAFSSIPVLRSSSGSLVAMGAAIVIANLGLGTRTLAADLSQLPPGYNEAAQIFGAAPLIRLTRISAPLVAIGLINVWRTYVILAMLEVNLLIFVYLPETRTLSVATLLHLTNGYSNTAYPLAVMQVGLAVIALGLAWICTRLLRRKRRS